MRRGRRPSGAEGDRTPDLCNANAALSQLSYSPAFPGSPRERLSDPIKETAPRERGADSMNIDGGPARSK